MGVPSILSVSLLLAPAAAFNLAARFPKTPATCDARRSSNAVARLGFLQDTRATEMAGSESTTRPTESFTASASGRVIVPYYYSNVQRWAISEHNREAT